MAFFPEQVAAPRSDLNRPSIQQVCSSSRMTRGSCARIIAIQSPTLFQRIGGREVQASPRISIYWSTTLQRYCGAFAACTAPNSVGGFHICSPAPGSSVGSPVKFFMGASGSVPMRKSGVWSDAKADRELYSFSHYAF